MTIVVDINALMFNLPKCIVCHHHIEMKFSLKEARDDESNHEAFERAKYGLCCIDIIRKAMEILRGEFKCVFVFEGKTFTEKELEMNMQ